MGHIDQDVWRKEVGKKDKGNMHITSDLKRSYPNKFFM